MANGQVDPYEILAMGQDYDDFGRPLNQLSSQYWDLISPMSDTQVWNRVNKSVPDFRGFSPDVLLQLDPSIRGAFADAVTQAEGDPYAAYSALGVRDDPETEDEVEGVIDPLIAQLMPQYEQLARGQSPGARRAFELAEGDEESQRDVLGAYAQSLLEDAYTQAAPTSQRNVGMIDQLSERFSGRPYQGGPAPGAPEQAGGMMAGGGASGELGELLDQLAGSPAYEGIAEEFGIELPERGRSSSEGQWWGPLLQRLGSERRSGQRERDDDDGGNGRSRAWDLARYLPRGGAFFGLGR